MNQTIAIREAHTQRLRQLRISVTWPRLELMRILHEAGKALSAQDIFYRQQSAGQSVPLSSIYVNLKRLEDAGIISRIRLDSQNKNLYSLGAQQGPMHLVCLHCGQLQCMATPEMAALMHSLCTAQGAELQDYALTLNMVCAECLAAQRAQARTPPRPRTDWQDRLAQAPAASAPRQALRVSHNTQPSATAPALRRVV